MPAGEVSWYRPLTLDKLLEVAQRHPQCKLVGGNTEVGIETKIQGRQYKVLVDPTLVPEVTGMQETEAGLLVRVLRTHSCVAGDDSCMLL